jgi:hypothetical protein
VGRRCLAVSTSDYGDNQPPTDFATSRCRGQRRVTATIGGACEFTEQMLPYLERALEHPDMTEELADVLLTLVVALEYRVESDAWINK